MAKGQKRDRKILGSLIPEIKGEEKHLDELLAGARAEADRLRQEAEAEADSRLRAARAALPRVVAAERESRVAAMKRDAASAAREAEEQIRADETAARAAMDGAVAHVVGLVWPGKTG